jgi:hypothetical protein
MTYLFTYGVHGHEKYIWKKCIDLGRVTMFHIDKACKHDLS